MASASEREIRDAVADYVRPRIPGCRIIHELVVGGCRADLAAVSRDRITLFEIKSERDTLKRLPEQVRQFSRAAHAVVVVAHEKWFDRTPYLNGKPRLAAPDDLRQPGGHHYDELWCYPEPDLTTLPYAAGRWDLPRLSLSQPHAAHLLWLMWRDELYAACARLRVSVPKRANMKTMIDAIAWHCTGKEIAETVCRNLRMRPFPEADAPILEQQAGTTPEPAEAI